MTTFARRIILATGLGAVGGVLCAWGAATHGVPGALSLTSAMFWFTVFSRMTLGFVIGVVGVVTLHPVFSSVRMGPLLRGIGMGVFFSLPFATSVLIGGAAGAWGTFAMILFAGVIIGVVTDFIVTKRYGQGKELLTYTA